jgi:hypothetical protein
MAAPPMAINRLALKGFGANPMAKIYLLFTGHEG